MEQAKSTRMSRGEFRRWCAEQDGKRYERVDGEPVAMSPETRGHTRLKYRIWQALDAAVVDLGLPCEVVGDGATVEINEEIDYEPDVSVECGESVSGKELSVKNPVIVVEVLSRRTKGVDSGEKIGEYFKVPSIMHYLICHADKKMVVHLRRGDSQWNTTMVPGGMLTLDPPGVTINLDDIYWKSKIG
jgi:Uma2 family endonuclease